MEVVLEGVLEMGRSPSSTSSRDWKPRLFVLKKSRTTKRSTLDYFKDTRKRWQKQGDPTGVISLWPSFSISIAHSCEYKYAMVLRTSEQEVYLAAGTIELMNRWMYHIQIQRMLDKPSRGCLVFNVQPRDSTDMSIIGAQGECSLAITSAKELICALFPSREVVAVWPFNCLRRYWCGDRVFGIECGRRSPHGQGEYTFVTSQDEEIYHSLHNFINKASRSGSESGGEVDMRPQVEEPEYVEDPTAHETPVATSESEGEEELPDLRKRFSMLSRKEQEMAKEQAVDNALGYDSVQSPPVPPKPPTMKRRSSEQQHKQNIMKAEMDVSRTSPAYLRRVRTHTGTGHRYLHEAINEGHGDSQVGGADGHAPTEFSSHPPVMLSEGDIIPTRDPAEEDTYSHTVHTLPQPFCPPTVGAAGLYNALVHTQRSTVERKARPSSQADSELYDVAYPPSGTIPRPLRQESDYSIVTTRDQQSNGIGSKMPLGKTSPKQTEMKPTIVQEMARLREEADGLGFRRRLGSDSLTINPLYGSQEKLLAQVVALDALEGSTEVVNNPVYSGVTLMSGPIQPQPHSQAPSLVPQPQESHSQAPSLVPQPQESQSQAPSLVSQPQESDSQAPSLVPQPQESHSQAQFQVPQPQSQSSLLVHPVLLPNDYVPSPHSSREQSPSQPRDSSQLPSSPPAGPQQSEASQQSQTQEILPQEASVVEPRPLAPPPVAPKPNTSTKKDSSETEEVDKPVEQETDPDRLEMSSSGERKRAYSKVDKSKKRVKPSGEVCKKKEEEEEEEGEGNSDSPPPPVPERNYSYSEVDS